MGEPFLTFLQRWRQLYTRYSRKIPETEKLDIFTDNLLPDFGYKVQLQGPRTFEDMVTQAIRIEEFMVKKGELTLHKDKRQGSTSVRDKSKYANKNREVVHDGVVDNITPKPAKVAFNLTDNIKASKKASF